MAGLTDGGFVVVWHSIGQDGDQGGVYGQRYDANGNPQGNEFQIHTTVTGQQLNPSIAALTDGGFVVTWDSSTPSSSYYYDVYGQVFNSDGSTQGNEFLVNTYTTVHQLESSVTGLSDGRFVATWDSFDQDSSREGVFGQIYNADGTLYGSEFQVNTYTWVRQSDISVTDLGDGGFVVTWHSYAQDGHDNGIFGQIYNPNGTTQGNEFQINSHTTGHQSQPSVAGLNDGGFVVSWESISQDGSFYGIYAQIYNADGTTQGSEFKVNTYTTGSQFISSVTALSDGGFVVVWVSDDQDGSDYGVFAQKFNADGSQNGGELQVNESTDGNQSHPSVAALDNGDFVVTWDSTGTDAGIRSRIFSDAVDPTGTVTITGIGDIGETLTADTSTLADVYGLGTLSYQWLRAGVAISGATSAT
ncbi:MAG: hypothetical protein GY947_03505, partial [Rhodobacteraceae bacterium]|nr:hypothetical protein [Paracoccaceae bacterium]